MDTAALSGLCAGTICVRADLDRQWVLPFGVVTDVESHVRETVAAFHRPPGRLHRLWTGWPRCAVGKRRGNAAYTVYELSHTLCNDIDNPIILSAPSCNA